MNTKITSLQQYKDIKKELHKLESLPYRRGDYSTALKISNLRNKLGQYSPDTKRKKTIKKITKIKTKSSKNVCCILCKKPVHDDKGLLTHIKHKHCSASDIQTLLSLIKMVDAPAPVKEFIDNSKNETNSSTLTDTEKKITGITDLSALNKKNNVKFFDVDVYNLACRSLTKAEAIRIAKSELLSRQFSEQQNLQQNSLQIASLNQKEFKTEFTSLKSEGHIHNQLVSQRDSAEQIDFKKRVMRNFSNVCAITRSNLPILQACHLEPFSLNKNHSTNNGIPLEPTLHAMLDRGLLAIHPHNMTIHFSIECYYKKIYEGKKIAPHYIELDKKALHKVWKNYLLVIKTTRKQLDDNGGTLAAEY